MAEGTPDNTKNYPLQHEWTLWVGKKNVRFDDSMVQLCDFKTVQEFSQYWNSAPRPNQCFGGSTPIDSLQIFKKGVKPMWEDVANASGGEWQARSGFDLNTLSAVWENLVMGLVGEQIDEGDEITGARVVDKSRGSRPVFRIELWYRDSSAEKQAVNEALRTKLVEVLNHGMEGAPALSLNFERVSHNDKKW